MSKEIFLAELQEKTISFMVSKWIMDRIPFVFEDDLESYIRWKENLAEELGIDSKAMIFVGSSGFRIY